MTYMGKKDTTKAMGNKIERSLSSLECYVRIMIK